MDNRIPINRVETALNGWHSRKITLNTALGNKTMEAVRVAQKESERQQQGQAKRNGMRVM